MTLPPGQQEVAGFPRFGTHFNRPAPAVPDDPTIHISGAVTPVVVLPVVDLTTLPRRTMTADFHCVSGWSATDLVWEGVAYADLHRLVIQSALLPGTPVSHVVFCGLDGFRSIVRIEDALADDVLIADRLDGRPLADDHGAPVRLVSPSQYGYVSTKHLCGIEVHTRRPRERYHPARFLQIGLQLVKPHRRARVWREERHQYLPGRVVRPIYRQLIRPIAAASRRGSRT